MSHDPAPPNVAPPAGPAGVETDLNTPMLLLVGVIFAVVVFVVIFLLQGLFYQMQKSELQRKVIAERPEQLLSLQTAQQEQLNSYSWVDRSRGIVSIPIERAMQLQLQRLQQAQAQHTGTNETDTQN